MWSSRATTASQAKEPPAAAETQGTETKVAGRAKARTVLRSDGQRGHHAHPCRRGGFGAPDRSELCAATWFSARRTFDARRAERAAAPRPRAEAAGPGHAGVRRGDARLAHDLPTPARRRVARRAFCRAGPCSTTTPTRTGAACASSSPMAGQTRSSFRSPRRGTRAANSSRRRTSSRRFRSSWGRPWTPSGATSLAIRSGRGARCQRGRRGRGREAARGSASGNIGTVGHGGGAHGTQLAAGRSATSRSAAPAAGVEAGALFVYSLPAARRSARARVRARPFRPAARRRSRSSRGSMRRAPRSQRGALRQLDVADASRPGPSPSSPTAASRASRRSSPQARRTRFMTYGGRPRRRATRKVEDHREEPKRLVWVKAGVGCEEHLPPHQRLHVRDRESQRARALGGPRHGLHRNATLTGPDAVDFDTAGSRPLAVFAVDARKNVERKAHAVEGLERRIALESLTAARLTELVASPSLPAADRVGHRGRRPPARSRGRRPPSKASPTWPRSRRTCSGSAST